MMNLFIARMFNLQASKIIAIRESLGGAVLARNLFKNTQQNIFNDI